MNVLDVALDPERAGVVVAGSPVPLGDRYGACAAAGVAHVGVRARDLELVAAGTPDTVSGSVYVVEPLGDEVFGRGPARRRACVGPCAAGLDGGPGFGHRRAHGPGPRVLLHPGRHDRRPPVQPRTARSATKWKGFCHDRQPARQPSGRPAAGPRRVRSGSAAIAVARRVRRRLRRRRRTGRGPPERTPRAVAATSSSARSRTARSRRSRRRSCRCSRRPPGPRSQFLTEPYDSFFAKAFQDGQSKAGQYDIYIMDDPWIPQFAAAGILEDLGAHGITADSDYAPAFAELGYWPPQQGPRVKGFENDAAQADRPADDRRPADPHLPQRRLHRGARHVGRPRVARARRASRRTRSSTASCSAA